MPIGRVSRWSAAVFRGEKNRAVQTKTRRETTIDTRIFLFMFFLPITPHVTRPFCPGRENDAVRSTIEATHLRVQLAVTTAAGKRRLLLLSSKNIQHGGGGGRAVRRQGHKTANETASERHDDAVYTVIAF